MATPVLGTAAMAVMFPLMIYRRIRNNIGKQALNPRRLKVRIGVMLTLLTVFGGPALLSLDPEAIGALAGGMGLGFLLSRWSLSHTTFTQVGEQQYYVPNPWIGMGLSVLLLSRMAWRAWQMWPTLSTGGTLGPPAFSGFAPLTLAMLAAILSYNAAYLFGILTHPALPSKSAA